MQGDRHCFVHLPEADKAKYVVTQGLAVPTKHRGVTLDPKDRIVF